jgi:hypothetical protein
MLVSEEKNKNSTVPFVNDVFRNGKRLLKKLLAQNVT